MMTQQQSDQPWDMTPAQWEEDKAKLARAEIEAMYTIAIFVEDMKGEEDAVEAQSTSQVDVDSEVRRVMEHLILTVEIPAPSRLLDLVKSEPVNSGRLHPKGKAPALHDALRTLISSKDHPFKWIAADTSHPEQETTCTSQRVCHMAGPYALRTRQPPVDSLGRR